VSIDPGSRVLVIDDDAVIRETLATALGDEGYSVRCAEDGRAGLETLAGWAPDVIVLDLMMPVMDGHAFLAARAALGNADRIPVIILSAAHQIRAQAAGLNAAAVFPKPFDLGALLDTIARLAARAA
jgi:CheY-like chemotaxis protein